MEIYLVRHAKPLIEKGICYGKSDIEAEMVTVEKLLELKTQLPTNAIVYCSNLKRSKQLAEQLQYNFTEDERLQEINFGEWELKKWDEIPEIEINPWMANFKQVAPPNGESFETLHLRTLSILNTFQNNTLPYILFTHAGVIRSINCWLNNIELENAFNLKVEYLDVIKLHK